MKNVRAPWLPYSKHRKNVFRALIDRDTALQVLLTLEGFLPTKPTRARVCLLSVGPHALREPVRGPGAHWFH